MAAVLAGTILLAACSEGSDVRHVHITIADEGCRPPSVDVEAGRTAHLQIQNETAQMYRVSDDEDRIEALVIDANGEGEAFYELPHGAGEYTIRCAAADGTVSTVILKASTLAGLATRDTGEATGEAGQPGASLAVTLAEFSVTPSETEVDAGRIRFIATNISGTMSHELNVLRLEPDGSFERLAGAEPIGPQGGGSFEADLEPGTYRLACLIAAGEAGSTVDHYRQGMWTDITVR